MDKNKILAGIMLAPEADIPEIIAVAMSQWASSGRGVSDLLVAVADQIGKADEELKDEFETAMEDWM